MAHEITSTDSLVLHKTKAWHGLGVVVEDAPTPREALTLAGLDWGVNQYPMVIKLADGTELEVPNRMANFRADNNEFLGIVRESYQVISNAEVADFAEALADVGKTVKIETAGSIRGGQRVWFLLKGGAFEVGNGDEVFDYFLLSNGHDGGSPYRGTPTKVRTVCSNTLHAVIPRHDTGELGESAFVLRHTSNVMEHLQQAKEALKNYMTAQEKMKFMMNDMSKKPISNDDLRRFFFDSYTADFGDVVMNPMTSKEERAKSRALSAYDSFSQRFDDERELTRASWWGAFNGYSGLVQHDSKARGKDDADRLAKRENSNLFGLNTVRTISAWIRACKMSGVA